MSVRRLDADEAPRFLDDLALLLMDAVEGGASVSFMHPLELEEARTFWRGEVLPFAAFTDGRLDGTVLLHLATAPNQPHRAKIAKLLVHRRARRLGIGRALMAAAEEGAGRCGRTLLVPDTASAAAEHLYRQLGSSAGRQRASSPT